MCPVALFLLFTLIGTGICTVFQEKAELHNKISNFLEGNMKTGRLFLKKNIHDLVNVSPHYY